MPSAVPELTLLLAIPLTRFAQEGAPLEIRVPWWPATLFFVPDLRHAEALGREGISHERVWTDRELLGLLSGQPSTSEALRVIMAVRREFAGEVVVMRPAGSERH